MAKTLDVAHVTLASSIKTEKLEDGSLLVHGKATDETVDSDRQIVDLEWAKGALSDWLKTGGNVRVQHNPQLYPAGRGIELDVTDRGDGVGAWLTSKVVEANAIKLTEEGVLSAYSVGIAHPKIVRDAKAPGGRIVGGEIVEVSLVDRPANPSCKLQLVKSVDGEPMATGVITGDTTKAEGEPEEAAVEQPAPVEEPTEDAPAEAEEPEPPVVPTESLHTSDVTPEMHAVTSEELAQVSRSMDAESMKRVMNTPAESATSNAVPKVTAKKSASYAVKRIHDALCDAYHYDEVVEHYPTLVKDGIAGALGPTTKSLIYQMLSEEVTEDGGSGAEADDICHLAKAYDNLCDFLEDEANEYTEATLLSIRSDIHKRFADAYPTAKLSPSAPPAPGQFRRPRIDAGHQRDAAGGIQDNSARVNSDGNTPSPHSHGANASPSEPGSSVESVLKGSRTFYTNASKDSARAAMQSLHDHIQSVFPDLCPMDVENPADREDPTDEAHTLDTRADSKPHPVDPPAILAAPGEKADVAELVKAAVDEALKGTVAELQKRIDELESAPDPNQAKHRRAMSGVDPNGMAHKVAYTGETQKRADAISEEQAWYRRAAMSGDPATRLEARRVLKDRFNDTDVI